MSRGSQHSAHKAVAAGRIPFAEPGVENNYAPSRAVRITDIDVTLELHPKDLRFSGRATYRVTRLPGYRGAFGLDLGEVVVTSVKDTSGADLAWSHNDERLEIRTDTPDGVTVTWHGQSPRRGIYFIEPTSYAPNRGHSVWTQCQDEDAHAFMPCHDHPGSRHTWRITIDAPTGLTQLSNGERVNSVVEGGRCRTTWVQREPMPAYLFTVVCAPLEVVRSTWRDKTVEYYVPAGTEQFIERAMGETPEMMEHYSRVLGVDYPWFRYDQVVVHDFVFGGMENTGCTTMTEGLLAPDYVYPHWDPSYLTAHELAHQWFGNFVTCQDWSQGWLNESWATYLEAVWCEKVGTPQDVSWYRYKTMARYFGDHDKEYRRPIVSYKFREPIDLFDTHLYHKGSCVLWTLRSMLGDDTFWAATKAYLESRAHDTVHTRDFQRAFEDLSGRNLDRFFHQWIHSAGHPELTVTASTEAGTLVVKVEQTQTGDDVPEVFELTLPLEVVFEDGTVTALSLPVRERSRGWAIPATSPVACVRVDPGLTFLGRVTLSQPSGWLARLVSDTCPVLSWRAVRALLGKQGKDRSVAFDALTTHPSSKVRAKIASEIAAQGGNEARRAVLSALESETSPDAIAALIAAVGTLRGDDMFAFLREALDDERWDVYLQGIALETLGKARKASDLPRFTQHLSDVGDWSDWRWQKALLALGWSRQKEAATALHHHLLEDQPQRIRATAALALGRLAKHHQELKAEAREALCHDLSSHGMRVQLGHLGGLVALGDTAAIPALHSLRRRASDGRVMRVAYEATVRLGEGKGGDAAAMAEIERLRGRLDDVTARLERLEPTEH